MGLVEATTFGLVLSRIWTCRKGADDIQERNQQSKWMLNEKGNRNHPNNY